MSTSLSEPYTPTTDNRQSLPLILTVILLIFFFLGFFSIYFCRYVNNATWLHRQPETAPPLPSDVDPRSGGLHPSIIASFPTFTYALVKDHRQGKCSLECAVCLSEFSDDDVLRLLTVCNHAFHPDCIDLWFESHTTCPVCRQNLDPAQNSPEKTPEVMFPMPDTDPLQEVPEGEEEVVGGDESRRRSRVSFKEEEEEEEGGGRRGGKEEEEGGSTAEVAFVRREHVLRIDWLPRSHSTGHSLIEEDERYTLRLPENVKERIARERNWTRSCCIVFEDLSDGTRKDDERSDFSLRSPHEP